MLVLEAAFAPALMELAFCHHTLSTSGILMVDVHLNDPCTTETLPTCHRAGARCEGVWSCLIHSPSIAVVIPHCDFCLIRCPPCCCVRMWRGYPPYNGEFLSVRMLRATILLSQVLSIDGCWLEVRLWDQPHGKFSECLPQHVTDKITG